MATQKIPQHNHLLITGRTENPLKNKKKMKKWLRYLVEHSGMHTLRGPFVEYIKTPGSRGLMAVVMIETSHITLNILDEPKPAHIQFDIYTCSSLNVGETLNRLVVDLKLTQISWVYFNRSGGFKQISTGDSIDEIRLLNQKVRLTHQK